MKKNFIYMGWFCLSLVFFSTVTVSAATSDTVKKRGFLRCGVSTGIPGFSSVDEKGNWSGLDVDICRGVAAAVLGNAREVKFSPLAENESYTALLSGDVDILARNSTWTFSRDSALAVNFAGISYYDGQGLLIAGMPDISSLSELKKVKLCSQAGSGLEENLIDWFVRNKIEFKKVEFAGSDLAVKGFEEGRCDALTMQQSMLYGIRLGLSEPDKSKVLPDVISKEPLGPVVRQGDDTWFDIVKWSLFVMIGAEELGVSSKNVDEMKLSNRLAVRRLLGLEGNLGRGLGLKGDWAYQVIKQVGNYGEVFERNLGEKSLLKVDRGLNRIWNQGGLHYCPPFR